MKKLLLIPLLLLIAINTLSYGQEQENIIPQAQPVYDMLKAIKDNNIELFKSSYSTRMQKEFLEKEEFGGSWEKILSYMSNVVKNGLWGSGGYGEYNLNDFNFEYSGQKNKGGVITIYKGKKEDTSLDVIQENGTWKIDEY